MGEKDPELKFVSLKGDITMMRREDFLREHPNVKGDMVAYTSDGEKLGRVTALNEDSINIEKGFFFPRDFFVRYDNVIDIHGNELIIDRQRKELSDWKSEEFEGWSQYNELNRGGDIEIPLREEVLQAQKTLHKTGEVRLKKIVHTEVQSFSVPVTKEEVVIERSPGGNEISDLPADERAFSEQETTIPLMEEEVDVVTRQRVKETVHAKKVSHTEQHEVRGEVRIEDLEVKTEEGKDIRK